ncbi:hypothetical protein GCM10022212_12060 [Actimicrobium antarcticum]|uniref:Uncharacterized protein n=1 Tax=Actimicrobium antarcticum TaxID=1051899 RepID=A0ABP7SXE4_9BURK
MQDGTMGLARRFSGQSITKFDPGISPLDRCWNAIALQAGLAGQMPHRVTSVREDMQSVDPP